MKGACTVGKEVYTLQAGDFLDIPLQTTHNIRISFPYVVDISKGIWLKMIVKNRYYFQCPSFKDTLFSGDDYPDNLKDLAIS